MDAKLASSPRTTGLPSSSDYLALAKMLEAASKYYPEIVDGRHDSAHWRISRELKSASDALRVVFGILS